MEYIALFWFGWVASYCFYAPKAKAKAKKLRNEIKRQKQIISLANIPDMEQF